MSIALYRYRLFWDGCHGGARNGRVLRTLTAAPVLPGCEALPIDEIDYAPEVHVAQLRSAGGPWRDMTPPEVAGAEILIAKLENPIEPLPLPFAA